MTIPDSVFHPNPVVARRYRWLKQRTAERAIEAPPRPAGYRVRTNVNVRESPVDMQRLDREVARRIEGQ